VTFDTAGGTETAITLTTQTLANGYSKTFIASAGNSGAATTINDLPVYKANSTTAPTIVAGKAYTIWYNATGNCFFVKASAEGTAVAAQVLAGATFSNDNEMDLTGAIPSKAAQTYAVTAADQTITAGQYLSGDQVIKGIPVGASYDTFDTNGQVTSISIFGDAHWEAFSNGANGIGAYRYLTTINSFNGTTSIGIGAFSECTYLTAISLPRGLISIGYMAFIFCANLTKVWVPSTCTTIDDNNDYTASPFYSCSSSLKIYCEASSKPSGWGTYWNYLSSSTHATVIWGESLEAFEAL
jgi:hypothetical protein